MLFTAVIVSQHLRQATVSKAIILSSFMKIEYQNDPNLIRSTLPHQKSVWNFASVSYRKRSKFTKASHICLCQKAALNDSHEVAQILY